MALSDLAGWGENQAVSACGAGDRNTSDGNVEEKPAACGSACGAGDKNTSAGSVEEKPAACGSACGAGDK